MNNLRLGAAGEALIKSYEQFRPTAYLPTPKDVWTIGWGHTHGVKQGDTCTQATAQMWLEQDVADAASTINRLVTTELTQNEFDALVSFTFNVGVGAFGGSTILKLLNEAKHAELVAPQFLRWDKQAGRTLPGLTRRREAERALFLKA